MHEFRRICKIQRKTEKNGTKSKKLKKGNLKFRQRHEVKNPALFSMRNKLEISAEKFDSAKNRADQSRFNVSFLLSNKIFPALLESNLSNIPIAHSK